MNSEPMCVPCVIKQCERLVYAMNAKDKSNEDVEKITAEIRRHALDMAAQLTLDDPPSKYTSQVLTKVYALLATNDPYQRVKHEQNEIGKKIYGLVQKDITKLADPIHAAIKYAASGNIIDVGPAEIYASHNPSASYLDEINKMINQPLKIDHYKTFGEKLRGVESILYILDNTGEIYLDKLLIERLKGVEVTIAVKALPILNDATIADATEAGLDTLGKVIKVNKDKECRYLGVDFDCVSDEFSEAFDRADIVIAKGHANFESLVDIERDCFFILMAKCPVVARKLGIEIKDRAFYYSPIKGE